MTGEERPARLAALGATLFVAAFVSVLLTSHDYGIASDVGNYFYGSLRQLAWLGQLGRSLIDGDPGAALSRDVVLDHWRWYPERIPHPPLSRELGAVTYALFRNLADPLSAYRMAAMATYAALVAGCALFTARAARSRVAGIGAGLALLTVPALFSYGHFANTDVFVTAFWFGSAISLFRWTRGGRPGALAWAGVLFGAAAATKFSGLLLLPVASVWLLVRRRPDLEAFIAFSLLGVFVFFVVNPVLWVDPLLGLRDYLEAGLQRSGDLGTRITTEYFGRIYEFRPPWHYPFVWTLIVIPLPPLAAMAAGATSRRDAELLRFLGLNVAVLYGALLLPAAPLHDGIRLFLPVFPFLCVLAGVGAARASEWAGRTIPTWMQASRPWTGVVALGMIFGPAALRTIQYHPYQLSYFNAIVGGTRGAESRGLEVTVMKEVLNREALVDLAGVIPPEAVVDPGFFLEEVCFYQAVGWAPAGWGAETSLGRPDLSDVVTLVCEGPSSFAYVPVDRPARDPDYVFVLNRRAQWRAVEWALYDFGDRPAYEVSVEGVPLMRVYRVGQ